VGGPGARSDQERRRSPESDNFHWCSHRRDIRLCGATPGDRVIAGELKTAYAVDDTGQRIRRVSPLRAFPSDHFPIADEPSAPELEVDQTIAPSPEAEIVLRAKSDIEDHSAHRVKSLRCWSRNDQDEIAFPSSWVLTRPAHA
jgi:hypothetical protein